MNKSIWYYIGILYITTIGIAFIIIYSTGIYHKCISNKYDKCQTDGWEMDTLYHPSHPNSFIVSLHYYQEIEYKIDTIDVIEEDGIRWYTLDTIQYQSVDTTILYYPWGREEIYYFKYKEDE